MEQHLATRPKIAAPSITLFGADDGLGRPQAVSPSSELAVFTTLVARRVIEGAGHFMPREQAGAVSSAIIEVAAMAA
jgi:pimeloyl-ACP methyl ester carboxylesterase